MDKVFLLMRVEHGDNTILGVYRNWRSADNARITAVQSNEQDCYSFYVEELEVQP